MDEYPAADKSLTPDWYVDDVVSGTSDPDLREEQINQSTQVLALGGFKFKYLINSGEDLPEGASSDGEFCKLLGYRWNHREDFLSPGLGELYLLFETNGIED